MDNLYKHTLESPYHVSVGAVLFNTKGEICFHKYLPKNFPDNFRYLGGGLDEMYVLMRETVKDNEPLESAVLRGVEEEFGAVGAVDKYLGALLANVYDEEKNFNFEKNTLYHSVELVSLIDRDTSDIEGQSELVWLLPEKALAILEKQVGQTSREELNEVEIIKRFIIAYDKRSK